MNNSLFEKNKITVPHIDENIVERGRLFSELNKSINGKILFLSASAGYGKTTLVASWLKHTDIKYLWFSMDEQDNEPIRLVQYLCRGIAELFTEYVDCSSINSKEPSLSFERLFLLLQNINEKVLIILEDYHTLKNPACIEYIEKLAKSKPKNVEIIISSRSPLPHELEPLLLRQKLELLSESELAFSKNEINRFFQIKKKPITKQKISIVEPKGGH